MLLGKIFHGLYDIQIRGEKNIPESKSYIVCMNHESYLDGLWFLEALNVDKSEISKIAYMAAMHTNEGFINKSFFRMIGGIPVDRFGNTVPAYLCAKDWIEQGNNLIIHPEGARSRDGSMLPFKDGAAKLAIDTDTCIVPIRIDGAFEIFPRTKKVPRLFRIKGGKFPIRFTVGESIDPKEYNVQELTQYIKDKIEKLEEC